MKTLLLMCLALAAVDDTKQSTAAPIKDAPAQFVRARDQDSPLFFRVALGNKPPRSRARDASDALAAALDADTPSDVPLVNIAFVGDAATIHVKGRAVAMLTRADADAEGLADVQTYAAQLETRLYAFVVQEERRAAAQSVALRIFASVTILVVALLTLRAVRRSFSRWQREIEERVQRAPLRFLGVVLMSGEALRGVLAVTMLVLEVLTYFTVLIAAAASVLSQFAFTRPWLELAASSLAHPFILGARALTTAVPGIVLALALLMLSLAALRFSRLVLDDVESGRLKHDRLPQSRVPTIRLLVNVAVVTVLGPLIAAAMFSRFGSPPETVLIVVAAAVAFGGVPLLASAWVGAYALWREDIHVGDMVRIGARHNAGSVKALSLLYVTLEDATGVTIRVPRLATLWSPLRRAKNPPLARFRLVLPRPAATVPPEALRSALPSDVTLTLTALTRETLVFDVGYTPTSIEAGQTSKPIPTIETLLSACHASGVEPVSITPWPVTP